MNRIKKHRIKEEKASTSRNTEDHDLAYFIHDRVELMHQVFSVLKSKELKSFAPSCVRRLSIDDLQELCLEELLGISSKRLCAILDGAEPPSDTESSSQSADALETISLDSISSDDEILSQGSKKKKHKHRHSRKKRRKKSKGSDEEQGVSRASRAGLTVLELLELQARARAIRAQLHQEPSRVQEPVAEAASSDNDEVLIKEEPAEVVEISSDEEKPDVKCLQKEIEASTSQSNGAETNKKDESQTVSKRVNDLIITVPQSKPTRKIKLKRQKPAENVVRVDTPDKVAKEKVIETNNAVKSTVTAITTKKTDVEPSKASNAEAKNKTKKSKKKRKKVKEKKGSDEDEITIQLSDSEKMDLLEDLDAKNLDTVTSSDSSDSSEDSERQNDKEKPPEDETKTNDSRNKNESEGVVADKIENEEECKRDDEIRGYVSNENEGTVDINELPIISDEQTVSGNNKDDPNDTKADDKQTDPSPASEESANDSSGEKSEECSKTKANDDKAESSSIVETKSDGEISDRESSEVEASDLKEEIVCISDDEGKSKKKKKKDKKSRKDKKKSDFREGHDENFYKDKEAVKTTMSATVVETIDDDDDVYEYLEISDDSSCYEVEGVSVLSKEPTAEEIKAFSDKMDEIELDKIETVVLSEETRTETNESSDIENVSWKDRYLGSKKVKRVLTTSNILNAIRKKNIELKKKLEEAKRAEREKTLLQKDETLPTVEDGTIEQYETLQGSTKYVDPVKEPEDTNISKDNIDNEGDKEGDNNIGDTDKGVEKETTENVTKEMKKDAKMLLKMYKRLLKYNDITKQKGPNKQKKKKHKKNKDKDKEKVADKV